MMLKKAFSRRRGLFFFIAIGYLLIYLVSIDNLVFGAGFDAFEARIASNWQALMFRSRVSYIWEPIGQLTTPFGLAWIFSPLNLLLGTLLGALVALNGVVFLYTLSLPKACRLKKTYAGFFGMILGFLSGFTCCVPTFVFPLIGVFGGTVSFFVRIRGWLIPLSVILLIGGVILTLKNIDKAALERMESKR